MAKKITIGSPPSFIPGISPEFRKDDFDVAVHLKGYRVIHESAVQCPCKTQGSAHLPSCKNCGGIGWVFINATEREMLITSIERKFKNAEWSRETIGTVQVTARLDSDLGYMDRLTIPTTESIFSQVLYPKMFDTVLVAFATYDILSVIEMFKFNSATTKLQKLEVSDYQIVGNRITFDSTLYSSNMTVTVRYKCPLQYHIIDLTHEQRRSNVMTDVRSQIKLPLSAIARRAHYVLDPKNFDGDMLFDNSYLP